MKSYVKYFFSVIVIIAIMIVSGCGGSSAPTELSQYTGELKLQMQTMMDVLNQGLYSKFMSEYVDTSYINSKGGLDQSVLLFDNEKQTELYNALMAAKNLQPFYNKKNNELIYAGASLPRLMTFVLINGKWYLRGDWFKN